MKKNSIPLHVHIKLFSFLKSNHFKDVLIFNFHIFQIFEEISEIFEKILAFPRFTIPDLPHRWHKKRAEVAAEVKRREEVDEASHSKIQEELEATRAHLVCARDELQSVSNTHERMQGEIAEAKEKICNAKQGTLFYLERFYKVIEVQDTPKWRRK